MSSDMAVSYDTVTTELHPRVRIDFHLPFTNEFANLQAQIASSSLVFQTGRRLGLKNYTTEPIVQYFYYCWKYILTKEVFGEF